MNHKLPIAVFISCFLMGEHLSHAEDSSRSFVDAVLDLMIKFKTPPESDDSKLERWTPLVDKVYDQCKLYEEKTHVSPKTCAAIAINAVYWETGLQQRFQDDPKSGPSGEECYFQIHRAASSIPFDEWRPVYEYGTRNGRDVTRCVEDGVRIFSYHLWRCGIDQEDLQGDTIRKLWKLYSQYYLPDPNCRVMSTKRPVLNRAHMARRLLRRLQPGKF